jgi:exosome complex RNA-binding protein Rrp42 (RNase PH superfamily)
VNSKRRIEELEARLQIKPRPIVYIYRRHEDGRIVQTIKGGSREITEAELAELAREARETGGAMLQVVISDMTLDEHNRK